MVSGIIENHTWGQLVFTFLSFSCSIEGIEGQSAGIAVALVKHLRTIKYVDAWF